MTELFCKVCGRPLPPRYRSFCPVCSKKYRMQNGEIVLRSAAYARCSMTYRKKRLRIAKELGLSLTKSESESLLSCSSDIMFDNMLNGMILRLPDE